MPFYKNNGVIAAAQVLWQTLSLLIVYRTGAQAAGVGALGAWSTAVAVAGLITLADLGLTDVMVREVAGALGVNDGPRLKGICRSVARFVPLAVGALGLLAVPAITYLLRALAPGLGDGVISALAVGSIASVWLTVLITGTAGVLEAFGRYDLKGVAAFAGGAVAIPAAYAASRLAPQLTVAIGLVAGAAVNLLFLLGTVYAVLKNVPGEPRAPSGTERKEMLRRGINIRAGALANLGFDPLVRFLLLRFGGAEAAGLYEIAYRVVIQLRAVFVASTQVIVPRLTRDRARGDTAVMTTIGRLTASSVRLACPVLWGILIVLPLLSAVMLHRVDVALLIYGLALTVAWLVNAISVPAYYGNFVDGALAINRTSHAVMLVAVAVLGLPAGLYFGALGVVLATALAIGLGSAVILLSRRRDVAGASLEPTLWDFAVNLVGLAGTASVFVNAWTGLPLETQIYWALATALLYAASSVRFVTRLAGAHIRQVAG